MANLAKIARRSFLVGSVAVVGGVAFGVYAYHRDPDNPLLADLPEGAAALTPFVRIDADGITLITPRHDVGQGAASVQAMLIAEELDVRLDQVALDFGPPGQAYYNRAIADEGAPFAATDDSWIANAARKTVDAVMKLAAVQITGGSTTTADAWHHLRQAGASARETLKLAASARTGVPLSALKTADGAVILPDGTAIPYTDLAADAATREVVRDVPLRDPSDWKLIGKPVQRADILAKSTGTQVYPIDVDLPGMIHATVLLAPSRGGLLSHYDDTAARAMAGVIDVFAVTGGVAVLGETTWHAFQGAQAVVTEWTAGPHPAEQADHWALVEAAFDPAHVDSVARDDGDVDAALSGGIERAPDGTLGVAGVLSAEYRAPYLAHAPLEPLSATARFADGRLELWTATQVPAFCIASAAKRAGVAAGQVRLHNLMAGGSFGHRLEMLVSDLAAEIAAKRPDRPVKLTFTREEDFRNDYPRQIAMAKMRGKVADGRVVALDLGIAMPSVMGSQMGRLGITLPGPDAMITAGAWDQPFGLPDYRVTGYRVQGLGPVSSWRSVGASTNGFFHESALDELIAAAGADPLAERLRLVTHPHARAVLEAVGEMSGWGRSLPAGRGLGLAYTLAFGTHTAEVVEVEMTDKGIRIHDVWLAAEVGRVTDPVNFENQAQGGVLWGLGHAINGELTYAAGAQHPQNFFAHDGMRMARAPRVHVRGLENGDKIRGIGEPPVPPAAPALANAIFAATGQRLREMPFSRFVAFA